jgi:5-methylcytosine-specific restriction endonuclease McrA
MTQKACELCNAPYSVPTAHEKRHHCCSKACSFKRRAQITKGEQNPSWAGGMSRFPYPWNFNEISRGIIARDGSKCQNPDCTGHDSRLTTHHINYEKQDCRGENLICLCSSCNSKANFGRDAWAAFYQAIIAAKKAGGGWNVEEF